MTNISVIQFCYQDQVTIFSDTPKSITTGSHQLSSYKPVQFLDG